MMARRGRAPSLAARDGATARRWFGASLMRTPAGEFVCLYHEADDLAKAFHVLATSESPYLRWFRQKALEIHGLTPEMLAGPPPAERVFDWPG